MNIVPSGNKRLCAVMWRSTVVSAVKSLFLLAQQRIPPSSHSKELQKKSKLC